MCVIKNKAGGKFISQPAGGDKEIGVQWKLHLTG